MINRPVLPSYSHPIETGKYLLGTREVEKMYLVIKQWLDNRAPGGIAYGRPRLGKTQAIQYLKNELLYDYDNKLCILNFNCQQHTRINENSFIEQLLQQFGHALPYSGRQVIKLERLVKFLHEKSESLEKSRIVIFMDDAQRLVALQYNVLMDIYNHLQGKGINMTVILVGQEELRHVRSAFINAKMSQIVGRFMVHEHQFYGIRSKEEMEICLQGYDQLSEYPIDSGWSYTRYYFPDAFEQGFRLIQCVDDIYLTIDNLRKEKGISGVLEIPMQYFTLTIEYVLKKYGVDGSNVVLPSISHWELAIKQSGYIENELYNELIY